MKNRQCHMIMYIFFIIMILLLSGCSKVTKKQKEYCEAGIQSMDEGKYQEAIDSFEAALNEKKGTVGDFQIDLLKRRGEAEYLLSDYLAAAHTYDILIQVDKDRAEYEYLHCMSLSMNVMEQNGDSLLLDQAAENFNKGCALDEKDGKRDAPGNTEALLLLGESFEAAGRMEDAVSFYKEQAQKTAGHTAALIYNRLAVCLMKEESYDQASQAIGEGLKADPEETISELRFNQAVLCEYTGDFAKAEELFKAYENIYGQDAESKRELEFLETR